MHDPIAVSLPEVKRRQADCCSSIPSFRFNDDACFSDVSTGDLPELLGNNENPFISFEVGTYSSDRLGNKGRIIENSKKLFGEFWLTHGPETFTATTCKNYREFLNR